MFVKVFEIDDGDAETWSSHGTSSAFLTVLESYGYTSMRELRLRCQMRQKEFLNSKY